MPESEDPFDWQLLLVTLIGVMFAIGMGVSVFFIIQQAGCP